MGAVETETYGMIVNTLGIGASICSSIQKGTKGQQSLHDELHCFKWLDSWAPASVIYVCFGSMCNLSSEQWIEIGLALEASNKPFIWVVRGCSGIQELEKWITESGFEERNRARSLVIHGWAPQTLILSHPAVGGFLTHCGWNSTLEGICAGVPLLTWPLHGDQFINEKLVEQILKISVRVGVEFSVSWGEEEKIRVVLRKEKALDQTKLNGVLPTFACYPTAAAKKNLTEQPTVRCSLLSEIPTNIFYVPYLAMGDASRLERWQRQGRRERAREFGEMAKKAVGSSDLNITQLIQDIMQQGNVWEINVVGVAWFGTSHE
ncbi:UDP-glycosyltransferase 73C1 [Prunus yedoensis var. nudiflora]|uniref:UDP-glycosyltransferase 73C1 n=1 Tax=Prunus yedoensis var. nudiflora TaxID=2094558 RepID=A0A314ZIQ0_PRUYE|nr:UDP-glycosyltransferase 73C1 [Prunus yedoensis var. nudiflora]